MKPRVLFALLFLITFSTVQAQATRNIVLNGDFSDPDSGWITTGYFNYNTCTGFPCSTNNPYAYTAPNCSSIDNASGTLSQSIVVPSNCSGGTFTFFHRTGTTNTSSIATDYLNAFLIAQDQTVFLNQLSNLNASPITCSQVPPIDVSNFLIQHKGQTITLQFSSVQSDDQYNTIFRIDDVQLNVTTSDGNGSDCITWVNGSAPSDPNVVNAANYLCQNGIITSTIDVSTLPQYPLENAAFFTLSSLYSGLNNIPIPLPTDNYPTMISDITAGHYPQAVKAMTFLEYGDGVPCISRDFYSIHPTNTISLGDILRLVLEAYNIAPDLNGQNIFSHSPSFFFCNIYTDDYNYGYFQRAYELGLLNDYYSGCTFQSQLAPGEFFLVILQRVYSQYQHPLLDSTAFYTPNNRNLNSESNNRDVSEAYFESYEQDGFTIPSSGIGLHFGYSYHSDLTELPLLKEDAPAGSLAMESAKELLYPLGIGWTHTYDIYAQPIADNLGNDAYLAIKWGNGETNIFDLNANKYITQGIHDISTAYFSNGKVQTLDVKTKDQLLYQFQRDGALLLLQSITDRNNNTLQFNYEASVCGQQGFGELGSYKRLLQVVDNFGGRYLQFSYKPGTDVLSEVADNTGRKITFDVAIQNLTLTTVTNQANQTTNYTYLLDDPSKNLLHTIQRPKGNSIVNQYDHKKLFQTTTDDYKATIQFTHDYTTSNINTQTAVTVTPASGVSYTTSYTYVTYGNIVIAKDSVSNTTYVYGDLNNPTLPTIIRNEYDNLAEVFEYDGLGNITKHSRLGSNGDDVVEYFTYDQANDVLTHKLANGSTITYQYDQNYNLKKEAGPLGHNKIYTRDNLGRIQSISDGVTQTNLGYNGYGNVNTISIEGTTITQTAEYDELSRIKTITDAKGIATNYTYDPLDNITKVVKDPNGLAITTEYTFDANNNVTAIKDPNQNSTQLYYNNSDDIIQETKGNLSKFWIYNNDGSVQQYIDKNSHQFDYTYYPSGDRNEGQLKNNGYQNFVYIDGDKQLQAVQSVQNPPNENNFRYDDLLRIQLENCFTPDFSSTTSYEYDISSNITKVSLPQNKYLNYTYDSLNRISSVTDWNNALLVQYSYKANGQVESETLGNGVIVHYHYDAASRLDSIWSLKSDGTLLHAVGCTMDNAGNHTRESSYVNWTSSYYRQTLNDPNSYTYDASDHLVGLDGVTINSDHNGNILNNFPNSFSNATYDLHNNLLSCTVDGKNKIFTYDAQENRIGDDNQQFVLDYVNNSNVLAIQQKGSSDYQQFYAHSPYGLVCSVDPATTAKTYYLYDFRGSTVALIDDNQNITQYYKYNPFGEIIESSDSAITATPFLFVGKYGVMYESPHLYYMRARYYDPTTGRFQGEDKNWSTNLFTYGDNNPLSNIDPSGENILSWNRPKVFWNIEFSEDIGLQAGLGIFGYEVGDNYESVDLIRGSISQLGDSHQPINVEGYYFSKNNIIKKHSGESIEILSNNQSFDESYNQSGLYCVPNSYKLNANLGPISLYNNSISFSSSFDIILGVGLHFKIEAGLSQ